MTSDQCERHLKWLLCSCECLTVYWYTDTQNTIHTSAAKLLFPLHAWGLGQLSILFSSCWNLQKAFAYGCIRGTKSLWLSENFTFKSPFHASFKTSVPFSISNAITTKNKVGSVSVNLVGQAAAKQMCTHNLTYLNTATMFLLIHQNGSWISCALIIKDVTL